MRENDNVYQNLKGLVWSAFIGIVSFQILPPSIWGYLHNVVGIGYEAAYWIFIVAYFLLATIYVSGQSRFTGSNDKKKTSQEQLRSLIT